MKKVLILGFFATVSTAALAQESVTMKFTSTGAGRNLKMSTTSGSDFKGVFSGALNLQVTSGSMLSTIAGLCADPRTTMASGSTSANLTNTSGLGAPGARAAHLVNKYFDAIQAESDSGIRNDKMMALQAAVWEVLVETGPTLTLTSGLFQAKAADGGAFTAAQQGHINNYLADNGSSVANYYQSALNGEGNPVSQSIMTPVPEPATFGALAVGALALIRRRKARP